MYPKPPLYLPFIETPAFVHMGLQALPLKHWLAYDNEFERFKKNKLTLHAEQPERVYAQHACSLPVQKELSHTIWHYLRQHHAQHFNSQVAQKHHTHTETNLWETSLWVQDDICLLQKKSEQYQLTAASLCAPSHWLLTEKIGAPIEEIHAPVPQLNTQIGKQINNTFEKLRPMHPYQRFNWSIKASDQLALFPKDKQAEKAQLFLRVERQCLMRLPVTQAIVFTIRVYIYPMPLIAKQPNAIAALKKAIGQMSDIEIQYKSMQATSQKFMQAY